MQRAIYMARQPEGGSFAPRIMGAVERYLSYRLLVLRRSSTPSRAERMGLCRFQGSLSIRLETCMEQRIREAVPDVVAMVAAQFSRFALTERKRCYTHLSVEVTVRIQSRSRLETRLEICTALPRTAEKMEKVALTTAAERYSR